MTTVFDLRCLIRNARFGYADFNLASVGKASLNGR